MLWFQSRWQGHGDPHAPPDPTSPYGPDEPHWVIADREEDCGMVGQGAFIIAPLGVIIALETYVHPCHLSTFPIMSKSIPFFRLCGRGFVEAIMPAKYLDHVTTFSTQARNYTRHGLGAAVTTAQVNTANRRHNAPSEQIHDLDDALGQWSEKNEGKRPAIFRQRPLEEATMTSPPSLRPPPSLDSLASSSQMRTTSLPPPPPKDLVRHEARYRPPPENSRQGRLLRHVRELTQIKDSLIEAQSAKDALLRVLADNNTIGKRVQFLSKLNEERSEPDPDDWESALVTQMSTFGVSQESLFPIEHSESDLSDEDEEVIKDDNGETISIGDQVVAIDGHYTPGW